MHKKPLKHGAFFNPQNVYRPIYEYLFQKQRIPTL